MFVDKYLINSPEALLSCLFLDCRGRCDLLTPEAALPFPPGLILEARRRSVEPLVVLQDAGAAKGLPARRTRVLPVPVDAGVATQRRAVGEALAADGAAELARLVRPLVVEQRAGMPVAARAKVAPERPLLFLAGGCRLLVGGLPAPEARTARPACGGVLSERSTDMRLQLRRAPEASAAALAQEPLGQVNPQVVAQGQLVAVNVAADAAGKLARLMGLPVVGQTPGVAVCSATLVAGERPLLAVRCCRLPPSSLRQDNLDRIAQILGFGSVLFVFSQMVQQLLLELEGFSTFLTGKPAETNTKHLSSSLQTSTLHYKNTEKFII